MAKRINIPEDELAAYLDEGMMIDKKTFDKIQDKLGSKLKVTQTSLNPPLYYWVMK